MIQSKVSAPITITDSAAKQLIKIREEQGIPEEYSLRIGVKGGGCAGFEYILGFDEVNDDDQTYPLNDSFSIAINKAHQLYLIGMEIDWLDGLDNRGFSFNNPNAKETCGCGTSFSA